MNYSLFFLCISLAILVLSLVTICVSPIINNVNNNFSGWRTLNCQLYADRGKSEKVELDNIQYYKKTRTLCERAKAMHDLEYASLIINIVLGFVCSNLSLLHYLNVGKDFEKKTGMIGFITGIIGFILTLVYVCYSGYIFTKDVANQNIIISDDPSISGGVEKLFSNGAIKQYVEYEDDSHEWETIYANDRGDYPKYIRYKAQIL